MLQVAYKQMESPIGTLLLAASDQGLLSLDFGGASEEGLLSLESWIRKKAPAGIQGRQVRLSEGGSLVEEAAGQLKEYFAGERKVFAIPLELYGTAFQRQVWMALAQIPYGEVNSYKDVAGRIGSPRAVRAVGGANNKNPIPIIIPCHRVIGANGAMVGYGGGLQIKTFLLELEGYGCRGPLHMEVTG